MRPLLYLLILLCLPIAAAAQDVAGIWRTQSTDEGHLEVQIYPCGNALCGKIVRAIDPQGVPGPYPHLGKRMIWDMTAGSQPQTWENGKIWDPRTGRTFNSQMSFAGGQLTVSGCVLGICQSQTWARAG